MNSDIHDYDYYHSSGFVLYAAMQEFPYLCFSTNYKVLLLFMQRFVKYAKMDVT